jgi:hypothetical protein
VTAREALAEVEGLGYRLSLRPGGLRLTGEGEPPPELLALIQEHRDALLSFLEEEARRWKAHEESLATGRIVPFPAHLAPLVHPSIRHLVEAQGPAKKGRNRHLNPELNQNT